MQFLKENTVIFFKLSFDIFDILNIYISILMDISKYILSSNHCFF